MKKQVIDLTVFVVSIFYVFIGWASFASGSTTNGGLLILGSLLSLGGVLTSMRKVKPNSTYLMLGGVGLVALTQLIMGSILFAAILGVLVFGVYATRAKK